MINTKHHETHDKHMLATKHHDTARQARLATNVPRQYDAVDRMIEKEIEGMLTIAVLNGLRRSKTSN